MEINISSKIEKTLVIFSTTKEKNKEEKQEKEKEKEKIQLLNLKDKTLKKKIEETLKIFNFNSKEKENIFFNIEKQKILIYGIKEDYSIEDLRRYASQIFDILNSKKETQITIFPPKESANQIKAIIEGLDLTDYKFDKYLKKEEKENKNQTIKINLNLTKQDKELDKMLKQTLLTNREVKFARNIINENSDIITPQKFEELSKDFAKKHKLKIKVLDENKIQKEKLNLLYAVGKGSIDPPRLIILEYTGDKNSKEKTALIGKGISFDTGGINLKPTGYIEDMKTDMGGAATVFAAFKAAVELKLKKNLILVLACAENSISHKAFKPGDIIVSHKGLSVEIGNTDAEGRLVLADAFSYVQKNYSPTKLIDFATLTGACIIALGPNIIAMLGNDEKLKQDFFKIGEQTNERVWELPIYEEHKEIMKSKIADLANIAPGGARAKGGTITAAAFLENFIEEGTKWIHFDIAGAGRSHGKSYYIPEFATGRGVRLLVEYLKEN